MNETINPIGGPAPVGDPTQMLLLIRIALLGGMVAAAALIVGVAFVLMRDLRRPRACKLPAETRHQYLGSLAAGVLIAAAAPVMWVVMPS